MDRIECVVVGAGVVGLAVARKLAREGLEVVVVEAAGDIGTGTSSRNSEVIHAGIYYPAGSLMARPGTGSGRRPVLEGGPDSPTLSICGTGEDQTRQTQPQTCLAAYWNSGGAAGAGPT